jgi:6-phosphogluconolactonase
VSSQWKAYADANAAAAACAAHIVSILEPAVSGAGEAAMAVSGGSTPKLLFDHLARSGFDWVHVHLFFVDERPVPPTHPQSNYLLAEEHLIRPARIPHRNVHRICAELKPDQAPRLYIQEIREFFKLQDGELPHFDLVHLGMGADAHIASLFPGEPLIENRGEIAAAVFAEKLSQWRITLLPGVLLAARHTAVLVAGEDKAAALAKVFHDSYNPKSYPAQMIAHHGRRVAWFFDEAAARLLT